MAKDGKKAGKLPKQIGGVKIPKELRKGAETLIAKAQSPEGRAAIANGAATLATMAATVAQSAAAKKAAQLQPVKPPASVGPGQPGVNNDALADAIGAGVDAVLGRLFPKK